MHVKDNESISAPEECMIEEDPLDELNAERTEEVHKTGTETSTMKRIVWLCLFNGILWVWCSYILAALDKVQIAESLSQVAVTEIVGVVLVYALKSVTENLSKNNNWPDKPGKNDASG